MKEEIGQIDGPNARLAYRRLPGSAPTIVWLGGFRSDMTGTKAEAIAAFAAQQGRAFLRFDYSGHGASGGRFEDGVISTWLADAESAIRLLTTGPLVLVGSSMGGWIAALIAARMKSRLAAAVFIAPAPDFTEELIWKNLGPADRDTLLREGCLVEPSAYSDEPSVITRALIEDGRKHLILDGEIDIECPVRIIQGMEDPDVPWRHAIRFAERMRSADIDLLLLKSGDHRLSTPEAIGKILAALAAV